MPAVDAVRQLCAEVIAWQRNEKVRHIPKRCKEDDRQRKLASRFNILLTRRHKSVGTKPCMAILDDAACAIVNSIPGVPVRGCSTVTGTRASSCKVRHIQKRRKRDDREREIVKRCIAVGTEQTTDWPGSVQRNKSGWRVQVRIYGNSYTGPFRRDKVDAEADLREAKEARTLEAMKTCLREIKMTAAATGDQVRTAATWTASGCRVRTLQLREVSLDLPDI
jgi:hypothetical protein